MKIAIVHDWLVTYAGAERVLEQMINVYPEADIFSLVDFLDTESRGFIKNKTVKTSFLQRLPFAKQKYRSYLPLMPIAIEQFDLSNYDLIISSSHAVAKGVITGPDQFHVCMCYSPIRYAWDLKHQYLQESNFTTGLKSWLARYILHKIKIWDSTTANGVDYFIGISNFIKNRIYKTYRREAKVIYPPVYTKDFMNEGCQKESFYVTSSRMVPYKRIDLIVRTFTEEFPDKQLIVIGDGPEYSKIKKLAGVNVKILGYQPFSVLKEHLAKAQAFIFAAEEDFGIAPLEALASGTPVIAFGKGGALETIDDGVSGLFFYEQTVASLKEAVANFEQNIANYTREACVKNSERFGVERFKEELKTTINNEYQIWRRNQ
jgi:glycosyltransferase involved in cell wall biosynthesis